jgi:hypothetical protein
VKNFGEKGETIVAPSPPSRYGLANVGAEVFGKKPPKFAAALVAAIIAGFVLMFGVEIDKTVETLILALAPVITAYWWPNTGNVNRATSDWAIDRNVALALGAALVVYFLAQVVLKYCDSPTYCGTGIVEFIVALAPVIVGALSVAPWNAEEDRRNHVA